ncbi:MAG: SDR family oxidoreductase [Novosphingobium sp.]
MDVELARSFALDGRVAVVTGAASGIGRETVIVLAGAGANVAIGDVNEAGLAETAALAQAAGADVLARKLDVSRRSEIDALADAAGARWGRIDAWVNVAGVILRKRILEAREEDLDRLIAINLKGAYWGCAAAARAMRETGGGAIVNISSGGGESPVPELSIYSLTKAGVNMLTRSAAAEFGPLGIRVNAVAPGWVDTPMGLHSFRDESGTVPPERYREALASRAGASPLGLTGTPRDIALAVLFLASDASRFTTGQILRPNGGVAMP